MPDLPDNSFYYDGEAAVTDLLVTNLNTDATYVYVSDDLGPDAQSEMHQDPNGEGIGGTAHTSHETGTITVQMDLADDTLPSVGHALALRGKYYIINGKVAPGRTKNQVVRVTLPVFLARNPILSGLLSAGGQFVAASGTESAAITAIPVTTVYSNRSGGTMAYAVDTQNGEYDALPAGLSINASTGEITGTPDASTAGSYTIKVVGTETLSGKRTAKGVGFVKLTVSS